MTDPKPPTHYGCEPCAHFGPIHRARRYGLASVTRIYTAADMRAGVLCREGLPQRIGKMRIEPVTMPCPSYTRREPAP